MHVILFGGAFDPPHVGHWQVVKSILAEKVADQVWLIPAGQHPFAKKMSADAHRLKMVELTFQDLHSTFSPAAITIETYELEKHGVGYSYETLRHFADLHPADTFSWLIGSDNVVSFNQWGSYQQLLTEFTVYVYPRQGFSLHPILPGMKVLTEVPEVAVSSTEIKDKIKTGQSIKGLVVPAVEQYIIDHSVYQYI